MGGVFTHFNVGTLNFKVLLQTKLIEVPFNGVYPGLHLTLQNVPARMYELSLQFTFVTEDPKAVIDTRVLQSVWDDI